MRMLLIGTLLIAGLSGCTNERQPARQSVVTQLQEQKFLAELELERIENLEKDIEPLLPIKTKAAYAKLYAFLASQDSKASNVKEILAKIENAINESKIDRMPEIPIFEYGAKVDDFFFENETPSVQKEIAQVLVIAGFSEANRLLNLGEASSNSAKAKQLRELGKKRYEYWKAINSKYVGE